MFQDTDSDDDVASLLSQLRPKSSAPISVKPWSPFTATPGGPMPTSTRKAPRSSSRQAIHIPQHDPIPFRGKCGLSPAVTPFYRPWVLPGQGGTPPPDQVRAAYLEGSKAGSTSSDDDGGVDGVTAEEVARVVQWKKRLHDRMSRNRDEWPRDTGARARMWREAKEEERREELLQSMARNEAKQAEWREERLRREAEERRQKRRKSVLVLTQKMRYLELQRAHQMSTSHLEQRFEEKQHHASRVREEHTQAHQRKKKRYEMWLKILYVLRFATMLRESKTTTLATFVMKRLLVPIMQKYRVARVWKNRRTIPNTSIPRLSLGDLKFLRPFRSWGNDLLQEISEAFSLRFYCAGEHLAFEGDPVPWLGVVAVGKVALSCRWSQYHPNCEEKNRKSRRVEHGHRFATRGEGECILWEPLALDLLWPFSAQCLTDTHLWVLSRVEYEKVLATAGSEIQSERSKFVRCLQGKEVPLSPQSLQDSISALQEVDWQPDELSLAVASMDPSVATDGEYFVQEGDLGRHFFYIAQGRVVLKRKRYAIASLYETVETAAKEDTAPEPLSPQKSLSTSQSIKRMSLYVGDRMVSSFRRTASMRSPPGSPTNRAIEEKKSVNNIRNLQHWIDVDPEEEVIGIVKAGEGFGEYALLWPEPRSCSAVACGFVKLWKLSKDKFQEIMMRNPERFVSTMDATSRVRDARLWRPPRRAVVHFHPLFEHLTDRDLNSLHKTMRPLVLAPGEMLVHRNEPITYLYFFLAGSVESAVPPPFRLDPAGTLIGMDEALVDGYLWPRALRSVGRSEIWCIPAQRVLNLLWQRLGEKMLGLRRAAYASLGLSYLPPGEPPRYAVPLDDITLPPVRQCIFQRE